MTPAADSEPQGTPVAYLIDVIPARHTRSVRVLCPYCERIHRHGWGFGDAEIGVRASECHHGGYRVADAA